MYVGFGVTFFYPSRGSGRPQKSILNIHYFLRNGNNSDVEVLISRLNMNMSSTSAKNPNIL